MANTYFLTWHTYGTWLHGDARGSVDALHNTPAAPLAPADPEREARMRRVLRHAPLLLDSSGRAIVQDVIRHHCSVRGWPLRAISVRSNHVHVVVSCPPDVAPERAMEQCKAWATRRLREAGLISATQPAWVEHGSTRWIKTTESLTRAVAYVVEQQ